jgi:ketosteroid isomerase-like protein
MITQTVAQWHNLVTNRDTAALDAILADNAVFHSPILHAPQVGKEITTLYLSAALTVFYNDTFKYVREVVSGQDAVLEFQVVIDGIIVNGIDMMTCDSAGQIIDFKVMLRPLKAVHLIQQKMMAMLQTMGF